MFWLAGCHPGLICLKLEQRNLCNIESYAIVPYFPNAKFIQGLKERDGWGKIKGGGGRENERENMNMNEII